MRTVTLSHATNTEVTFRYNGAYYTMPYSAVESLANAIDRYMDKYSVIVNMLIFAKRLKFRCLCDMAEKFGFSNQGQVYMVMRYLAAEDGPLTKNGHSYYDAEDFSEGGFIESALEDIWTEQSKRSKKRAA